MLTLRTLTRTLASRLTVVAMLTAVIALTSSCVNRGLLGYERIVVRFDVPPSASPSDQDIRHFVAECSPGKKVLGGGYHRPNAYRTFEVWTSNASTDYGWTVEVWNKSPAAEPLIVVAICADVAR
jgi:hypothetical protein